MLETPQIDAVKGFGKAVDFGQTAADYGKFRAGFPDRFFERLAAQIDLRAGQRALDIGTGAGTLARGLAGRGLIVAGVDIADALLREAAALGRLAGVAVDYSIGKAEELQFADASFDLVTAGQCWHWFDRPRAAAEAFRVMRPGGKLVIAHFDWLPLRGSVVKATEALILAANPAWKLAGGVGIYPHWPADMSDAGFISIETASFDHAQPYTHEAWRGRVRASAGVKGSLDAEATERFDAALKTLLETSYTDEPLLVPHRVWWTVGEKPGA
jgi:SAM-dependent methyltransferase